MEVSERLLAVFRRVFKDDRLQVVAATTASDVAGWDSIAHVQLITEVEKEFGLKFKIAEVARLKNVGDLAALIQQKKA